MNRPKEDFPVSSITLTHLYFVTLLSFYVVYDAMQKYGGHYYILLIKIPGC